MTTGNSHKTQRTNYSEQEYLALATALLGGTLDASNLERPLREILQHGLQHPSLPEEHREIQLLSRLMNALAVWYLVREDVAKGRFSEDSPEVQAAYNHASAILSICVPRVIAFVLNGDHETIRKLADIVEVANTRTALTDQTDHGKRLQSACKAMGIKPRTPHKSTSRIRLLLPLWMLGFGALSQVKRNEILGKAGLRDDEIPEDDALRQLLSYYKIPMLRTIYRPKTKAEAKTTRRT